MIFSHGFTVPGFESNRMFLRIAAKLVAGEFQCVLFDYRGSGYSDGDFADMTIQMEIEDLHRMIEFTRGEVSDSAALAIWGMSLGTAVAIEVVAEREEQIGAFLLWGLSAELYQRWSLRWADDFERKGHSILPSGFTVYPAVVEALRDIDTYASLRKLTLPRLFVAGAAEAEGELRMQRIAQNEATGDAQFVEIPDGVHGFKGQPELFGLAVDRSVDWLKSRVL